MVDGYRNSDIETFESPWWADTYIAVDVAYLPLVHDMLVIRISNVRT